MPTEYTIIYRGWEIDPVCDENETGDWQPCPVTKATHYIIYPSDDDWSLDVRPTSLTEACQVVDSYDGKGTIDD